LSPARLSSHAFGKADARKKSTAHNRLGDFFISRGNKKMQGGQAAEDGGFSNKSDEANLFIFLTGKKY